VTRFLGEKFLSNDLSKEASKTEIELMEKRIVYLTGRKRIRARQRYLQLLRSCEKNCGMGESIYIDRI
jgi:hypothetical protein